MQREVIDGIPFWCDKENLYYYDVNASAPKTILLGTKAADGTAKLREGWEQHLAEILTKFRAEAAPRSRKPA
jgi:hypothetical protein